MSDTDRTTKRSIGNLWVPIGSVVVAIGVVTAAAVTWATDRAELHSGTKANVAQDATLKDHQTQIDQLRLDAAARTARDEDLRRTLDRMQQAIDKIADRVGAKP